MTRARLVAAGLSERIATVPALLEASRVVLLLVRPQSLGGVGRLSLRPDTLVVSFLAGVPIARLPLEGTSLDAARVIPSAPDTIERRMAIAGVYPGGHGVVEELLGALGIRVHVLSSEEDLHAFTAAGVCLPIAFAYLRGRGTAPDDAEIRAVASAHRLPRFDDVLAWAHAAEPVFDDESARADFVGRAATPGGVTEAILRVLADGGGVGDALEAGIDRSRELGRR